MIYVTFKNILSDETPSIKNVWDVKCVEVEKLYIAFMHKKAEKMNITINPNWLNIMNYINYHSHLSKIEYDAKYKQWNKVLKQWNIDKFISEILNGRKEKFFEIHRF